MADKDVLSHIRRGEKAAAQARLDRLDADREKLAHQLHELDIAERVLSRFGSTPAGRRTRSDRAAGANASTSTRGRRRPRARAEAAPAAERGLYRGVKLQPLATPPKRSRQRQLQEAVKYAIAKNAAALAESK
jgi:hypothetical protein